MLSSPSITIYKQEFNNNLKTLRPLINSIWEGKLKSPDGTTEFTVLREYVLMDGGNVIKCTKLNEDLGGYGEGYLFWDDISEKIAFFFIENSGVFNRGFVTACENTISIEGNMTWPTQANPQIKQSFDFKNTFEFSEDGIMTDRWFQNAFGPWRPGHSIKFQSKEL